jgi:hypothetical protein
MQDRPEFEEFEALRAVVDRGIGGVADAALVQAARVELERRGTRRAWMAGGWRGDLTPAAVTPPGHVPPFLSLGRFYLAGLLLVAGGVLFIAISPIVGVAVWVVGSGGVIGWQLCVNVKRRSVLLAGKCLACGYDVNSLPRAIDPGRVGGADFGPLKCPECGRMWPVVPKSGGEG